MTMQPNKVSRCSGQRPENFKSANNPFDAALLSMKVASPSLLRRNVPRLLLRRENKTIDEAFECRLSEANQELASLLQEVSAVPDGALVGGTQGGPINELLMRAVRCAAKQYMLQAELGNLALTDELTGLYNRRGFMALAERQLKVGRPIRPGNVALCDGRGLLEAD